jgi:tetratricopeptide (TPR) repeat protein
MDPLYWLAEKLPTGKAAPAIAKCQAQIEKRAAGDDRASGHLELCKIYNALAADDPLLSALFCRLANYQLDQALLWKNDWPEPLGVRAALQIKEGDFPNAFESLRQYAEKHTKWLEHVQPTDSERVQFCKYLFMGGGLLGQLGQFAEAVEWFTRAREELERLPASLRCNEGDLQEGIFEGIVGCLLLDFRYVEARNLITQTLRGALFQAYESKTRHALRALDKVLSELAETTRTFESSKSAAEVRARLTEEIQRCDSGEVARRIRRDIVSTVNSTQLNRDIQELAGVILKILEREREELERDLAAPAADEVRIQELQKPDLSKISDPAERRTLEELTQVLLEKQREITKVMRNINFSVAQFSLGVNRQAALIVRDSAENTYRVPARYYLKWWWVWARRFIVQIVAVSYVLEQIIHKAVEEKGKSCLQILHFKPHDVIIGVIVILSSFIVGGFVERRIDKWTLKDYKNTLWELVGNRFTMLWTTYNSLLNLYAKTKQAQEEGPISKT